jgi:uncharacterized oligopeptide transporter (OPT) family protein
MLGPYEEGPLIHMKLRFIAVYCAGICPKAQFLAALIGSLASCGVSTAAYALFSHVYVIGGETLPAPTAGVLPHA